MLLAEDQSHATLGIDEDAADILSFHTRRRSPSSRDHHHQHLYILCHRLQWPISSQISPSGPAVTGSVGISGCGDPCTLTPVLGGDRVRGAEYSTEDGVASTDRHLPDGHVEGQGQ